MADGDGPEFSGEQAAGSRQAETRIIIYQIPERKPKPKTYHMSSGAKV